MSRSRAGGLDRTLRSASLECALRAVISINPGSGCFQTWEKDKKTSMRNVKV